MPKPFLYVRDFHVLVCRKTACYISLFGRCKLRNLVRSLSIVLCVFWTAISFMAYDAGAQQKPNILIIWGDDIGWNNPSAYHRGMMGYQTPNIDRIAREGMIFTDWYGQQSCTAGRSTFITGQSGFRTGLLKVGLPGSQRRFVYQGPDYRRLVEEPWLHDGPIREEPPGRSRRHLPTNHGFR